MRLIDADALIERIVAESNEPALDCDYDFGYRNGLTMAHAMVINTPTIEAEPVRHGRWRLLDNGDGVCEECRFKAKCVWDFDSSLRYCPNCGAKMDKE